VDVTAQATEALVPAFLLQPLVENALEHGIAQRPGPGRVRIAASIGAGSGGDEQLWLCVEDDGVGIADGCEQNGMGIATTRQRLVRRYGDRHRFLLEQQPGGGTRATIIIPFVSRSSPARDLAVLVPGAPAGGGRE
jgi:two-component system, LytTR family, sensor kinase